MNEMTVRDALRALRDELLASESAATNAMDGMAPTHRAGGCNLVHYLALRSHDLRPLQAELQRLGLSSLGRTEAHVMATLDAVLRQLGDDPPWNPEWPSFHSGAAALACHTDDLFGAPCPSRATRIMVTMPGEAAHDPELIRGLLAAGMDCMRINCAHDDASAWQCMIDNLRQACRVMDVSCAILMDIGGPKIRTGPLAQRPALVRWRPTRDERGRVIEPAVVRLMRFEATAPCPADAIPIVGLRPATFVIGDTLCFTDARGAHRRLDVNAVDEAGLTCTIGKSAWVEPGIALFPGRCPTPALSIGPLPTGDVRILLRENDLLELHRAAITGTPAEADESGLVVRPARIGCTLRDVFDHARAGQRVMIDDGAMRGVIERVEPGMVVVRVHDAGPTGSRLHAEKGLNFPDTDLNLPALGECDRADLAFIAREADMVGLSFVHDITDVRTVREELDRLGRPDLGLVLKIETGTAFEHTPALLMEAMRSERVGLMIARGDLAVECGFERLAELQEELLWIAEAAHVPAIWATQVLDIMARTGLPSRAEVTDAAMGERAECVMLNKGPHIVRAVATLDDILTRMESHQLKKIALLRRLQSWSPHTADSRPGQVPTPFEKTVPVL